MKVSIRTAGLLCAAALALVLVPHSASAQDYPTKNITVVVPFSAGGPSDVVARIIAEHMGRTLGQTMVIENVGGAGGTLGSGRVASAAPDGYTLLAGSMGSHVAAPVLMPNLKYNAAKDFVAVGITAHAPAAIVAKKDFPANDLKEFIAYVKANGDKVRQAHGGIGSSSHMACLMFNQAAGTKPALVAYRGTGDGPGNELRYAICNGGCGQAANWFKVILDQVGLGSGGGVMSLAISGGMRHITYYDADDLELGYATCASNCTNAAMWQKSSIDTDIHAVHSSFVQAGPFGLRHVAYHDLIKGDLVFVGRPEDEGGGAAGAAGKP